MTDQETPRSEMADELRSLGKNLESFLRTMWESEERKKVQQDIQESATRVGASLNEAANQFAESEAGQQLKASVEDIHQRIESGELREKARTEMLGVLKWVNAELGKAIERYSTESPPEDSPDQEASGR